MLLATLGTPGPARADSNIIISPSSPAKPLLYSTSSAAGQAYQYGDMTFSFSNCVQCGSLELLAVMNSRGGTEIEIVEAPFAGSSIFSQTTGSTGSGDASLSFTLTVGLITGSHGISSVTNILDGSDKVTSTGATVITNNSKVTSVLSGFSVTPVAGVQTSDLTNTSTTTTFSAVKSGSLSFTDKFNDNAGSVNASGYTLKLTDVKLLFSPAPEPASIALFVTGLMGLTAARRRFARRVKR